MNIYDIFLIFLQDTIKMEGIMKRKLREFTVKIFSLALAITMCIPTNVYAIAESGEQEEMPTMLRLDETQDQSEEEEQILEENRTNYTISQEARLSDSLDSIIYTIRVAKKKESIHDPNKTMTLSLATNKNQDLNKLEIEKVKDLDQEDVDYQLEENEDNNLHTLAITTPTTKREAEYTIKAPINKDELTTDKLYSLDLSLDLGETNIDLKRISYKFVEEASEENPDETHLVLTHIKEADDALTKASYKKDDEEGKSDIITYTDYLISKDKADEESELENKSEVSYKLTLDENQDKSTGEIALDYYKADSKGFSLKKEFSSKIPYQEDIDLDIPAGYLLKLTYTNQVDKTKTKVENYSVNNRQVKNPRFVKEEEKAEDDEEDPAPAEKTEDQPVEKDSNKQTKENESKDINTDKKEEKKEDKKEEPSKKEEEKAKEPTNLEKADAELKKALADPKNTIKEIQALLDSFEEKYKLDREDQEKLMKANNDAIVALVEKDRKENFRPNVLAKVSPSFEGKEFNLKTTMKALASKANPIPGGYYFDIKVGKYLTLKQGDYIKPLEVGGKVVAVGQYFENGDDHFIRYYYIDTLTSNVDIPIDQTLVFDTKNTQGKDSVDVVIQAQPKNNPLQTMKTITVKKDADSPVSTEFTITDGKEGGTTEQTTYPYQLSWRTTNTTIKNKDGKEFTTPENADLNDAYVEWDIEIDTKPLKDANVDFDNLNLTVFAPKNEGLDNFYFQYSNSPITSLEGAPQVASDNLGEIMTKDVSISKSDLGDKLYVKVKGMIDPSKPREYYSIGLRANPDSNYVEKIVDEFEKKFKAIPSIFKWAEGLDDAKKLAKVPFNLVETMIPARIGLRDNVTNERFYYDSSRTIVADRKSDTRTNWYALDLLRHGETMDPALDNPTFRLNTGKTQTIDPIKTYYIPQKDGGYRKTRSIRDVQLSDGKFIPGTLVSYEYRDQKGSREDSYHLETNLKQKQDTNFNLDGSGPTEGGPINLYTQKISDSDLATGYLAYIEKPYSIMRINQNFDMVQCFNSGVPDPTYDGIKKEIFLDKNENPTGDFLISRLNESIGRPPSNGHRLVSYLSGSKNFDGMNLRNGHSSNGAAMEDLMKRIYFYGEEVKDEYEGKFQAGPKGREMHRHIENSMYQRVLHRFTDGTDLTEDFFAYQSAYNDNSWRVPYTLTGKKTSKGAWVDNFLGKDLTRMMKDKPESEYLRKLRDDEERITGYPAVKDVQYEMAQRLYKKIQDSYQNSGEWTEDKANTVDLVFYSHNVRNGKYQELITGRVTKPIEIDKFTADGKERLEGAKFRFTNIYTRTKVEWTSQKGNEPSKLYLEPGTYRVEELEAPDGYEKIKPFNIRVDRVEINPDDGSYDFYKLPNIHVNDGFKTEVNLVGDIPKDAEGNELVSITNGQIRLEVKNTQDNLGRLEFVKRNNSTRLFGAGFTLKKLQANSLADAKKQLEDNKLVYDEEGYKQIENLGENGIFTFEQIPAGYYILEETKVPAGYQKAPLYLVEARETKDSNGKEKVEVNFVEKLDTEKVRRNGEEAELPIIKNKASETKISFRKVREEHRTDKENEHLGLADAKFRLMSLQTIDNIFYLKESYTSNTVRNDDKKVDGQNAEGGGYITFDGIKPGTYLLEELQAPKGYGKTKLHGWKLVVNDDLTHKLYEVPTEDDINRDDLEEVSLDDIIGAGDNIEGKDKKAYQIGNAPRKLNVAFDKYLSDGTNPAQKADKPLKDKAGLPIGFNIYKADYYGAKIGGPNAKPLNKEPIVQNIFRTDKNSIPEEFRNEDYKFVLEGLEFGGYYVLEEVNPPTGYKKSGRILLKVEAEAVANEGEMKLIVRDPSNNAKTGAHSIFEGVINYEQGAQLGSFSIKKVGNAIGDYKDEYGNQKKVGLRRAYFRLYTADEQYKIKKNAAGYPEEYIQKVTPGDPITRKEGDKQVGVNPDDLPAYQGIVTFDQLKPGNYVLEEYRGPAGYERDPNYWYINVARDGTVTKYRENPSENRNASIINYTTDTTRYRLADLDINKSTPMPARSTFLEGPSLDISEEETPSRQMAPQAVANVGWEKVDSSISTPASHQDSEGLIQTKITEIDKANKQFKQVFILDGSKSLSAPIILNLSGADGSTSSLGSNFRAYKLKAGSTLDNLIPNGKDLKVNGPFGDNNLGNQNINFPKSKDLIAVEIISSYTEGQKFGFEGKYVYDRRKNPPVNWIHASAKESYNSQDDVNKRDITYKLTIDPYIENGSVTADKYENIKEGDIVNLTVKPKPGYRLKSLTYSDENGDGGDIFGNKFAMPASNVQVSATFEEIKQQPDPEPDPDPDPQPSGNMDIRVIFTYSNQENGMDNSKNAGSNIKAGDLSLEVMENGGWSQVGDNEIAPYKGKVDFKKLDASRKYRLKYTKNDEELAKSWGTSLTTYIDIKQDPNLTEQTVTVNISNGNLTEIFNKDETGFRIPLRVSKVNENRGTLTGSQFRARKLVDGDEVDLYEKNTDGSYTKTGRGYPKYHDEEFDAVSEATGEPGDNYFRELSPGIYELWETKTPDDSYRLPTNDKGELMKWYFKVVINPDKVPSDAGYMDITFDFEHTFTENDAFNKGLTEKEKQDLIGKTIKGFKTNDPNFNKYIEEVPDDGRSNPARPDAPYKKVHDAQVTNYKNRTELNFKKKDGNNRENLEGATFTLRRVKTRVVDQNGKKTKEIVTDSKGYPEIEPLPTVDEKGKELTEAQKESLKIKPRSKNGDYAEAESKGNLGVTFTNISEGTYILEESKPAKGYEKLDGFLTITFTEDEKGAWTQEIKAYKKDGENYTEVTGYIDQRAIFEALEDNDGNTSTYAKLEAIFNKKQFINFNFKKVEDINGQEEPLTNSTFRITQVDENGKPIENGYQSTQRKYASADFSFENLGEGHYKLEETRVIRGYERQDAWYFDVVQDPKTFKLKIVFKDKDPAIRFTPDSKDDTGKTPELDDKNDPKDIRVANYEKTNFRFKKQDPEGKGIENVGFVLRKVKSLSDPAKLYEYDDKGRLIKLTNGDKVTTFEYEGNSDQPSKINGEAVTDTNTFDSVTGATKKYYEFKRSRYDRTEGEKNTGEVDFKDLDSGLYELIETNKPAGYDHENTQDRWIIKVERTAKGLEVSHDTIEEENYFKNHANEDIKDSEGKVTEEAYYKTYSGEGYDKTVLNKVEPSTNNGFAYTLTNKKTTTDLKWKKVTNLDKTNVIKSYTSFTLFKASDDPSDPEVALQGQSSVAPWDVESENGEFVINNLSKGIYALMETKAPAGYKKMERIIVIRIYEEDGKIKKDFYEMKRNEDGKNELVKSGEQFTNIITRSRSWTDRTKIPDVDGDGTFYVNNTSNDSFLLSKGYMENGTTFTPIDKGLLELKLYPEKEADRDGDKTTIIKKFDLAEDKDKTYKDAYRFEVPGIKTGVDYILEETSSPDGYTKTTKRYRLEFVRLTTGFVPKLKAVLDKDGNPLKNSDKEYKTETGKTFNPNAGMNIGQPNGQPLQIVNKKTDITFTKVNQSDEKLSGVTFYLKKDDPDNPTFYPVKPDMTQIKDGSNNGVYEVKSDQDGNFTFTGLVEGTYEVWEKQAPEGYITPDKAVKTFRVEDGEIQIDGENLTEANKATKTKVINRKENPTKLVIEKVDINDPTKKLEGATFRIEKRNKETGKFEKIDKEGNFLENQSDTSQNGWTETSGKDGRLIFNNLADGTYLIREIKAPEGYKIENPIAYSFTVKNGIIHKTEYNPNTGEQTDTVEENNPVQITNKPEGNIYFKKTKEDETTALPEAKFMIEKYAPGGTIPNDFKALATDKKPMDASDYGRKTVWQVDSDQDGNFGFEGLEDGIYRIVEIEAPDGYRIGQQVKYTFAIKNGQTYELAEDQEINSTTLDSLTTKLENSTDNRQIIINEKIGIYFQKVDGQSGKGLKGAEFDLYWQAEGTSGDPVIYTDDEGNTVKVTSDEDGNFNIKGLNKPGTYYLKETKAPRAYNLPEKDFVYTFKVGKKDKASDEIGIFKKTKSTLKADIINGRVKVTMVVNHNHESLLYKAEDNNATLTIGTRNLNNLTNLKVIRKSKDGTSTDVTNKFTSAGNKVCTTNLNQAMTDTGEDLRSTDSLEITFEADPTYGIAPAVTTDLNLTGSAIGGGDYKEEREMYVDSFRGTDAGDFELIDQDENPEGNPIQISNHRSSMPLTGGPGTWIGFTLLGTLIMSLGGAYIALKKKESIKA